MGEVEYLEVEDPARSRPASTPSATAGTARASLARGHRGPRDRGRRPHPLGQRLPPLRGLLPLLAGEHAPGLLRGGPEREVRMMLGENAAALYGFDLEALRPDAERVAVMPEDIARPLEEIPEGVTSPNLRRALYERKKAAAGKS